MSIFKPLSIVAISSLVFLLPTKQELIGHPSSLGEITKVHAQIKPLQADLSPQSYLGQKVPSQTPKPVETSVPMPTSNIESIIRTAAIKYGQNPDYMVHIARCESTLNPNAVAPNIIAGTHPTGLFQHVATYWPSRASKYGWAGASIFNAQAQAEVTAQMFRDGASGLWECH